LPNRPAIRKSTANLRLGPSPGGARFRSETALLAADFALSMTGGPSHLRITAIDLNTGERDPASQPATAGATDASHSS
jgi:hypothetical protein